MCLQPVLLCLLFLLIQMLCCILLQGDVFFTVMTWSCFTYCLLAGLWTTTDTLTREKNDGTLGLLFLTDYHIRNFKTHPFWRNHNFPQIWSDHSPRQSRRLSGSSLEALRRLSGDAQEALRRPLSQSVSPRPWNCFGRNCFESEASTKMEKFNFSNFTKVFEGRCHQIL